MKANAWRGLIAVDRLDQSFRRIEEKDANDVIQLKKKAWLEERQESVATGSARPDAEEANGDVDEAKSWKDDDGDRGKGSWWYGSSWWSTLPSGSTGWDWPQTQTAASLEAF
ncbi:unnamed protein product [Prorocentrum cordatum]|uniref:Uncharacterized protein n=1 Tax=Prorocentrum cordatum TaxID=2364126 RepID=A0ABN9XPG5_9DINO|nr:unnamed protein product [Polarella glacialis]